MRWNLAKSLGGVFCGVLFAIAAASSDGARGDANSPAKFNVTKFGAVGDGVTLTTGALQKAIDTCSGQGGGVVEVPAGKYLTGTIQLKDNVTLHLDDQAILLGSTNAADYINADPFVDGVGSTLGFALVVAVDGHHVSLEGTGAIDGQGKAVKAAQQKYTIRPFLVRWVRCTDVVVKDVTIRNSGAWGMPFFQCKNVVVTGVTIRNHYGLQNNDGIDVDSCQNVRIDRCDIESGDDAICLKTTSTQPCTNITATNCKLSTQANGFKIGTESIGDVSNIHFSDSALSKIGISGINLISVDGGHLEDVHINDITMAGVAVPITIRLGARLKTFRPGQEAKPVGILRDIEIKNVTATGVKNLAIMMNGIPDHPVRGISLENIQITVPGGGKAADAAVVLPEKVDGYPEWTMFGKVLPVYGIYIRHLDGISFKNVNLTVTKSDPRPVMAVIDVKNMTPANFTPTVLPAQ
jgi:polygalacturonase